MRAVLLRETGGPEALRLEEVEQPELGDGEVLVHVQAASVNPSDWKYRRDWNRHDGCNGRNRNRDDWRNWRNRRDWKYGLNGPNGVRLHDSGRFFRKSESGRRNHLLLWML